MKKILLIVLISTSLWSFGQNLPKFSNYELNKNIINPAAIFENQPTIKILYRNQWMGFDNAPLTAVVNATFKSNEKSGFGLYFLTDKAGIFHQNLLQLDYSYSLQVTDETYMNFGITGGFNIYTIHFQKLVLHDPSDPYIPKIQSTAFLPDINFGVVYSNIRNSSDYAFASLMQRYPLYYVGLSVQHLLGVIANNEVAKDNTYMNRHFNLMAGIMHPVGSSMLLEESLLVKYTPNAPVQAEAGAKLSFNENYWIGLSYRTCNDIITKIGIKYRFILFAYSFDFSIFKIPNKTSHEIVLGFILQNNSSTAKY